MVESDYNIWFKLYSANKIQLVSYCKCQYKSPVLGRENRHNVTGDKTTINPNTETRTLVRTRQFADRWIKCPARLQWQQKILAAVGRAGLCTPGEVRYNRSGQMKLVPYDVVREDVPAVQNVCSRFPNQTGRVTSYRPPFGFVQNSSADN